MEYSCFTMLLVSALQQRESAIHIRISPHFWISFPFRSPQSTEFPVLYSRFSLVTYFIHSINSVYMSVPISHFIPPPRPTPRNFFILQNWKSTPIKHQFLFPPSPQALVITTLLSVSMNLTILDTWLKWNHTVFVLL